MSTSSPATSVRTARLAPLTLTLLRVVAGALFMQHGVQKLFGWLSDPPGSWSGTPPFGSLMWVAGVLETFGGLLVVVGLLTRPTAFLLSGMMAVAYFKVHVPQGVFPALNGGEEAALFCFVFLHLFAVGAGPFSLDAVWSRRRGAPALAAARLALVAGIAGSTVSLGACTPIGRALGLRPADADGATFVVRNDADVGINVHALPRIGLRELFLGQVAPRDSRTFRVPRVAPGDTIALRASATDGRPDYRRAALALGPDAVWRVP